MGRVSGCKGEKDGMESRCERACDLSFIKKMFEQKYIRDLVFLYS